MFFRQQTSTNNAINQEKIDDIFVDFESRSNIVGLFDLLLKIDRRNNPQRYKPEMREKDYD